MTRLLPWFHYIYRASVTKQALMGCPSAKSYTASSYLRQLQQWLTQNFTTLYQSHMLNIINMQCQLCASVCASVCVGMSESVKVSMCICFHEFNLCVSFGATCVFVFMFWSPSYVLVSCTVYCTHTQLCASGAGVVMLVHVWITHSRSEVTFITHTSSSVPLFMGTWNKVSQLKQYI